MGDLSVNFSRREFHCTGCTPERPCWRGGIATVDAVLLRHLETIRAHFGAPITITSAFRCSTRNAQVGGANNSQHLYGMAADIRVQGVDPVAVQDWLDPWWPGGLGRYPSFTHIDVRPRRVRF